MNLQSRIQLLLIQELNNQYVVLYSYPTDISTFEMKTKYIILDKEGNLIKNTD